MGSPSFQLAPRPLNNELASELVSIKKDGCKGWLRSHVHYTQNGRKKVSGQHDVTPSLPKVFLCHMGDFIPFFWFIWFFFFHPGHMEITQPRSLLWSHDDCLVKLNCCIGSLSSKLSRRDNATIKLYGMSHKLEDLILRLEACGP